MTINPLMLVVRHRQSLQRQRTRQLRLEQERDSEIREARQMQERVEDQARERQERAERRRQQFQAWSQQVETRQLQMGSRQSWLDDLKANIDEEADKDVDPDPDQVAAAVQKAKEAGGKCNDQQPCPICLEKPTDAQLRCGHCFCEHCIDTWLRISFKCPLCRSPIE